MRQYINLVKLCVGVQSLADLTSRIDARNSTETKHVTRMWPKRQQELLAGGSLYWVIKGVVQARQRIIALDEVIGQDGIRRCGIRMDALLVHTQPAVKRPFQGWRYLTIENAPPDLPKMRASDTDIPTALNSALAEIGVL
ncbi:MAG: DUF1489 domain-containing protein [Paracoccaceae bacterium]